MASPGTPQCRTRVESCVPSGIQFVFQDVRREVEGHLGGSEVGPVRVGLLCTT